MNLQLLLERVLFESRVDYILERQWKEIAQETVNQNRALDFFSEGELKNLARQTIEKLYKIHPKYLQWIVNRFINGDLELKNEQQLLTWREILKDFDKRKRDLEVKDINRYNHFNDVVTAVDSAAKGRRDERVKIHYKDKDMVISIPETEEAACKLGKKTSWCTASSDKERNEFESYNKRGDLYVIDAGGDLYQAHFGARQLMDKDNEPVDPFAMAAAYPKLLDVFGAKKWFEFIQGQPISRVKDAYDMIRLASIVDKKFYKQFKEDVTVVVMERSVDAAIITALYDYTKRPFWALHKNKEAVTHLKRHFKSFARANLADMDTKEFIREDDHIKTLKIVEALVNSMDTNSVLHRDLMYIISLVGGGTHDAIQAVSPELHEALSDLRPLKNYLDGYLPEMAGTKTLLQKLTNKDRTKFTWIKRLVEVASVIYDFTEKNKQMSVEKAIRKYELDNLTIDKRIPIRFGTTWMQEKREMKINDAVIKKGINVLHDKLTKKRNMTVEDWEDTPLSELMLELILEYK